MNNDIDTVMMNWVNEVNIKKYIDFNNTHHQYKHNIYINYCNGLLTIMSTNDNLHKLVGKKATMLNKYTKVFKEFIKDFKDIRLIELNHEI